MGHYQGYRMESNFGTTEDVQTDGILDKTKEKGQNQDEG